MFARVAVAVPVGAFITFGLLYVMQLMIATGRDALTEPQKFAIGEFVRVERAEAVEVKQRKPDKLPEPQTRPDAPQPEAGNDFAAAFAVSVSAPPLGLNPHTNRLGFGVSDGEFLPIVKVSAVYPPRALARRLEGYVLVEFTVTPAGAVKDVVVVESTAVLFEEAAVEAALRFKYKPRVIDGMPVEVRGVRNRIVFALEA